MLPAIAAHFRLACARLVITGEHAGITGRSRDIAGVWREIAGASRDIAR